jgi:cell division protein FtsN
MILKKILKKKTNLKKKIRNEFYLLSFVLLKINMRQLPCAKNQTQINSKMKKIFGKNFIIFLGLIFVSCAPKTEEEPQIRIVDLQGKPGKVVTRTPELNMQAMASQNSQKYTLHSPAGANQKPTQNTEQEAPDYGEVIQKTIQPQPQAAQPVQVASAPVKPSDNSMLGAATMDESNHEVQYDLSQDYTQESFVTEEDKKEMAEKEKAKEEQKAAAAKAKAKSKHHAAKHSAAKKSHATKSGIKVGEVVPLGSGKSSAIAKSEKKSKQFFVQVGSFSTMDHAKQSLTKMEKFHKGKVETIDGEKTIYRVLLGPFPNRQETNEMVKKIKASGQEAILVKN